MTNPDNTSPTELEPQSFRGDGVPIPNPGESTELEKQLGEILSEHESLCEDQSKACGDCRRIKQALTTLIESRELRVWQTIKSCVENSSENTQRLLRFHLPDFDERIAELTRGEKIDE